MAVFVSGLVGILVFYLVVLAVGIWASTKQKNSGEEEVMLAGRSLGMFIGTLTLVGTWVGGGYINGTAEAMFTSGLAWCQVPIGYSLSFLVGMVLFVRPMRDANYITLLDPFQIKYGSRIGGLLFLPALLGDVIWVGAILNALGSSLMVILELDMTTSVIVSTVFAAAYTMVGGLYSVTYTDVLQLVCIVFGLFIGSYISIFTGYVFRQMEVLRCILQRVFCSVFKVLSVPFAYNHAAVSHDVVATTDWKGSLKTEDIGVWLDNALLLLLGGIPCQSYFQRILSIKSTFSAQMLSLAATFGCMVMAVPPAFIGVLGRGIEWQSVEGFNRNVTASEGEIILPLVLRFLTPSWVSFFGLGAICAAVMSSADSNILGSSSMFSRNIYKLAVRPKASEREVLWVLRVAVVGVSTLSAAVALTVGSVYYLSYLCADLVYVILFPQLLLVVHWSKGVNTYGCLASFMVGLVVRLLGGEVGLGMPIVLKFPYYDAASDTQKFPFKTLSMLCALCTHVLVSCAARWLFHSGLVSASRWDVLGAFPHLACPASRQEELYRQVSPDTPIISLDEASVCKEGVENPAAADICRKDCAF